MRATTNGGGPQSPAEGRTHHKPKPPLQVDVPDAAVSLEEPLHILLPGGRVQPPDEDAAAAHGCGRGGARCGTHGRPACQRPRPGPPPPPGPLTHGPAALPAAVPRRRPARPRPRSGPIGRSHVGPALACANGNPRLSPQPRPQHADAPPPPPLQQGEEKRTPSRRHKMAAPAAPNSDVYGPHPAEGTRAGRKSGCRSEAARLRSRKLPAPPTLLLPAPPADAPRGSPHAPPGSVTNLGCGPWCGAVGAGLAGEWLPPPWATAGCRLPRRCEMEADPRTAHPPHVTLARRGHWRRRQPRPFPHGIWVRAGEGGWRVAAVRRCCSGARSRSQPSRRASGPGPQPGPACGGVLGAGALRYLFPLITRPFPRPSPVRGGRTAAGELAFACQPARPALGNRRRCAKSACCGKKTERGVNAGPEPGKHGVFLHLEAILRRERKHKQTWIFRVA